MKKIAGLLTGMVMVMMLAQVTMEHTAFARVGGGGGSSMGGSRGSSIGGGSTYRPGGGGSIGDRGSRTGMAPARPVPQPTPIVTPQPVSPAPLSVPPPQSGGFMRNLAGGMAGGFLGGMISNSLFGGHGGYGGGSRGPGFFDLLLLGVVIFVIYRLFFRNRN